ncbi:MAG: M23 family metallopeptidase [Melioribacteraceae bacterium]|nr:M23 family metallopeptidase [Melioribacteraceae bacterium]
MKLSIKELKKTSFYVTPNFPDIQIKRYKFNFLSLIGGVLLYTIVVILFTVLFLMITPSEKLVFLFENRMLAEQKEKIIDLENKVTLLTNELENFTSVSNNLNRALQLGLADSVDSNSTLYDSLKVEKEKNINMDGDILKAFKQFWNFIQNKKEPIFFIAPIKGFINKEFNSETGHLGIDYAVVESTPVMASAGGYIIMSDYVAEDGNVLIIKHDDDYITVYKHCAGFLKKKNEYVSQGEIVALSGNSGINTYGPHLHFEIWEKGKPIDPRKVLINENKEN